MEFEYVTIRINQDTLAAIEQCQTQLGLDPMMNHVDVLDWMVKAVINGWLVEPENDVVIENDEGNNIANPGNPELN